MVNELQRFPVLRKHMDQVIGNFLREGLEPSETMIGHIIEMEVFLCFFYVILFYVPIPNPVVNYELGAVDVQYMLYSYVLFKDV